MGYRNREKEKKLLVALDMPSVRSVLKQMLHGVPGVIHRKGESMDTYWHAPTEYGMQMVRVRDRDTFRQLTIKGKDKGTNLDRVELDLDTPSSHSRALRFMRLILGPPIGTISKRYHVWEMDGEFETVSCYRVQGPGNVLKGLTVIEVEAMDIPRVLELEQMVRAAFAKMHPLLELKESEESLYEIAFPARN